MNDVAGEEEADVVDQQVEQRPGLTAVEVGLPQVGRRSLLVADVAHKHGVAFMGPLEDTTRVRKSKKHNGASTIKSTIRRSPSYAYVSRRIPRTSMRPGPRGTIESPINKLRNRPEPVRS